MVNDEISINESNNSKLVYIYVIKQTHNHANVHVIYLIMFTHGFTFPLGRLVRDAIDTIA